MHLFVNWIVTYLLRKSSRLRDKVGHFLWFYDVACFVNKGHLLLSGLWVTKILHSVIHVNAWSRLRRKTVLVLLGYHVCFRTFLLHASGIYRSDWLITNLGKLLLLLGNGFVWNSTTLLFWRVFLFAKHLLMTHYSIYCHRNNTGYLFCELFAWRSVVNIRKPVVSEVSFSFVEIVLHSHVIFLASHSLSRVN